MLSKTAIEQVFILLGGGHKPGSVKMCDTIRGPQVTGSYGDSFSPKASQHGYRRVV